MIFQIFRSPSDGPFREKSKPFGTYQKLFREKAGLCVLYGKTEHLNKEAFAHTCAGKQAAKKQQTGKETSDKKTADRAATFTADVRWRRLGADATFATVL